MLFVLLSFVDLGLDHLYNRAAISGGSKLLTWMRKEPHNVSLIRMCNQVVAHRLLKGAGIGPPRLAQVDTSRRSRVKRSSPWYAPKWVRLG